MGARVLVIGLDAMETPIVELGIAAGAYPTLAELHDGAARFVLTNPMRSHPGADLAGAQHRPFGRRRRAVLPPQSSGFPGRRR